MQIGDMGYRKDTVQEGNVKAHNETERGTTWGTMRQDPQRQDAVLPMPATFT